MTKGICKFTPLILAANEGLTDFYKCLIEAGADPNIPDELSLSFFYFSVYLLDYVETCCAQILGLFTGFWIKIFLYIVVRTRLGCA